MAKVRGIRFSNDEDARIEEFLRRNPILDFSTLAKAAIFGFLETPRINLTPLKKQTNKELNNVRSAN